MACWTHRDHCRRMMGQYQKTMISANVEMNTLVPPWNLEGLYVLFWKNLEIKKGMHCSEILREHRVAWLQGQGSYGMWWLIKASWSISLVGLIVYPKQKNAIILE